MAWSYTDAATVGKPNSPMGAVKEKFGRPAIVGETGLFDGSAIMDALGYGKNAGGINIAEPGGSPGNRVQPIATNTSVTPTPPQRTPLGAPEQVANKALNDAGVKPVSQQTPMQNTPSAPPAIAGGIKKTVGKFGETKFSDGSGGFVMNEQNRLAEVARQNADSEALALKTSNENMIKQANDIDPIFGMAAAAGVARNNVSRYTADQALAGHKLTADANVKAHELTAIGNVEKAKIAGQEKQREQGQKDYADAVKKMTDGWSKLNLPKEYTPAKLQRWAQLTVESQDPKGSIFILPPNRPNGGSLALPKSYQKHYETMISSGMSHNDAAARIAQVAEQNKHGEFMGDMSRFVPIDYALKQQSQLPG